jgi:hypothetical protein
MKINRETEESGVMAERLGAEGIKSFIDSGDGMKRLRRSGENTSRLLAELWQ